MAHIASWVPGNCPYACSGPTRVSCRSIASSRVQVLEKARVTLAGVLLAAALWASTVYARNNVGTNIGSAGVESAPVCWQRETVYERVWVGRGRLQKRLWAF